MEIQILHTGKMHYLLRITFTFNPARSSWTVNRKRFPLQPAYATTFNGCQGLMLEKLVLDLHRFVRTRGEEQKTTAIPNAT
ncbi:uncharacterized protein F5147DRAFT_677353 [Suillus discolor]|uniref:Uncharacterized protein n=1 Tax=Suillus discolor TaxID=1912936 RepID=A0A9P7JXL3_9AGAM|nr:uncharacterized protein F5147DRAFT_677353 [Suillus discolor]KAG2114612.1 hypothetical protein F5147DRAFT_677353 [Suillus discolor]